MKDLVLIGAGGYAKSVLDSVDKDIYNVVGFIDEFSNKKEHLSYPVFGNNLDSVPDKRNKVYFVSIGDNYHRKIWYDRLTDNGYEIINVIDKTAIISDKAIIGEGCFVGKMAIINSCSIIGNNCLINTKSLIEHGCKVENHVNVSTNTVLNGDVVVKEGSFVGSSSVVIGQLTIGAWSIIGAGAVVNKNVEDKNVVAGIPAKFIKIAKYE